MPLFSTIRKILDPGGEFNPWACDKGNAVYQAALQNRSDIVQLLIEEGADLSPIISTGYWQDVFKQTLITNDIQMAGLFLDSGANPNKFSLASPKGPLLLSIENRNFEFVELLLEKGADPNYTYNNQYQYNPLKVACDIGDQKIIDLLFIMGLSLTDFHWNFYAILTH